MLDGRSLRLATDDNQVATTRPASELLSAPLTEPIDPWRLFRLLRRQAWTFLTIVVAVLLLTALFLWQATPVYKASALVIVDPWQRSMLDADSAGSTRPADAARV